MSSELPPGKSGPPLLGETPKLIKGIYPFISDRLAIHGRVFKTNIMGTDTATISGPDSCPHFMDEGKVVRDGGSPTYIQKIFGGPSLSSIDGPVHRAHKFLVMKAFEREPLESYLPAVERQITESLERTADQGGPWLGELKRLAISAICENVLGMAPGALVDSIAGDYETLTRGSLGIPFALPGTAFRRALKARDRILEVFETEVKRHETQPEMRDGLSRILQASAPDGSKLSARDAVLELHHLIIAGYIIFAVFARTVLELDRHPEIRDRLRSEVEQPAFSGPLSLELLDRSDLLDRVVMEIKRITPILPVISGRSVSEFEYNGYRIPSGWRVLWAVWATNQGEQFTSPERFDPDRYLPERAEHERHPYAWTSQGPGDLTGHKCAGFHYSTYLMKAFTILIMRGFEWELPSQDFDYEWRYIPPEFKDGFRIRLLRRNLNS